MSHDEALNEAQVREVTGISKLEVREYFDHFLQEVWPVLSSSIIEKHNTSKEAHGGVEKKFNKFFWMLSGAAAVGGTLGAGVIQTIRAIVGM